MASLVFALLAAGCGRPDRVDPPALPATQTPPANPGPGTQPTTSLPVVPAPRETVRDFGALLGKRVVVSPGHGYYWNETSGRWVTQRSAINGLTEDIHTNEIAMDFAIPELERAGAIVRSCRERHRQTREVVVSPNGPGYLETGVWNAGTAPGPTYRWADTSQAGGAQAEWRPDIPAAGEYPVYVSFTPGTNRTQAAEYAIEHAGGRTVFKVDQRSGAGRWRFLGAFWFEAGRAGRVTLSNRSVSAGAAIAGAVRFGAGMGGVVRGTAGTSGQPRWKEAARYWAEFDGAPSTVYDLQGYSDHDDDVNARGRYADWVGGDAYVSIHTNAVGSNQSPTATGTETFIHDTKPSAGSRDLQRAVHLALIDAFRALVPGWVDRRQKTANFGEVRETRTMPAILTELAFHDNPADAAYLATDGFRRAAGRAIAVGAIRYLAPGAQVPPLPPEGLVATRIERDLVVLSWRPVIDLLESSATSDGFLVYRSADGQAWDNGAPVVDTVVEVQGLAPGTFYHFRVAATNSGGEGAPSQAITVKTVP